MFKDLPKWNIRFSAVYAFGIWTMFGSYAYFRYTGRYQDVPAPVEEEPDTSNKIVYESAHYKSVTIYKKDFVPYSTRLYNLIKSFSEGTGPGPGQGDK
uniref:Long intergenic non-protein coding RNA 493 n=1 Tax=Iconisemion striatum TaxID=60296 RepID=A0A1A7YW16_9TELE